MGFLDRVIGGVNQAHENTTDAEYAVFRDRRYDAAERLASTRHSHRTCSSPACPSGSHRVSLVRVEFGTSSRR